MSIKNLISVKRKEKHLTTTQLAQMIGVTQSTITRWERGEIQTIKNDKIIPLAKALGVAPGDIVDMPMATQATFEEQSLLDKFRSLSAADREEILALIDFKLARSKT